jgi:hypothetical protein
MDSRIRHLVAAFLVLAAGTQDGGTTEPKTWYVYCEGGSAERHWAVFSENFWPHPDIADYGRLVGSAAKAFFESRHDLQLDGCAAVNFIDASLAEHSRNRTAQLHRKMGDQVLYFPFPSNALPLDSLVVPTLVTLELQSAREPEPAAAEQPAEARDANVPSGPDR